MYEIFGIDNSVPIDIWLDFGEIVLATRLFSQAHFWKSYFSLLIPTTILNPILNDTNLAPFCLKCNQHSK